MIFPISDKLYDKPDSISGNPGDSNSGITGVIDKPLGVKPAKSDDDTAIIDSLIGDKDLLDLDQQDADLDKDDKEDKDDDKDPDDILDDKEDEIIIDKNSRAIDLAKIKEKYPDFAKTQEFKELRNSYHREAEYTELFPTLDDAREAAENNETYLKLNDDLLNKGDVSSLLSSIKNVSAESYKKITNAFLDTVARTDKDQYQEIISPVVKRLAKAIKMEGEKHLKRNADSDDGKALVATARNIMQYYFEDGDLVDREDPTPDPKVSEKERELSERETRLATEKFTSAYSVVETSVDKYLTKQILNGLDPDNKLNEFMRDTLVEKIKAEVTSQVSKDSLHMKKMNSLWKRAMQNGFNRESLSSIASAYLERARPIIPTVRNKFRSIAIKNDRSSDKQDEGVRLARNGRSGRAPTNDGRVNIRAVDSKKIDYRNTTDDDIFEGKVKLKG